MRGTECEEESSSRELRNIYRTNLATGLAQRLPVFTTGTVRPFEHQAEPPEQCNKV